MITKLANLFMGEEFILNGGYYGIVHSTPFQLGSMNIVYCNFNGTILMMDGDTTVGQFV